MKYESASIARSELALRITARALNTTKRVEVVPMQDELDKSAQRATSEAPCAIVSTFEILRLASLFPALKRVGNNGTHFIVAPDGNCGSRRNLISGRVVRQLVEDGLLAWVNESHTAAVLTERERGEP